MFPSGKIITPSRVLSARAANRDVDTFPLMERVTYDEALARYPKETAECVNDLRKSRSKFRNTPVDELTFRIGVMEWMFDYPHKYKDVNSYWSPDRFMAEWMNYDHVMFVMLELPTWNTMVRCPDGTPIDQKFIDGRRGMYEEWLDFQVREAVLFSGLSEEEQSQHINELLKQLR